ncbi:MAG: hypothetical protein LBS57_00505 [Treponema sp.]|jgi:hypothetical protein|nr:hypothetical protein [Treponema sp.]
MESKEKTRLQTAIDLLEENGFHVFEAEEEKPDEWTMSRFNGRTILLRIVHQDHVR